MGATDFTHLVQHSDAHRAFAMAVSEATHEHGHGGYSGTIAEKDGFAIIDRTVRSRAAAYRYVSDIVEASWQEDDDRFPADVTRIVNDKWGPAAAIPVSLSTEETERTLTITVNVEPERKLDRGTVENVLRAEGKLKAREILLRHNVSLDTQTRIRTERTKGKVVTRYFYANELGWHVRSNRGQRTNWISGFPSMAEWRADAEALARQHGGRYECVGISQRFDAEPLDVVEAVVTKAKATIKASIITPGKLKDADGWLFFGTASC